MPGDELWITPRRWMRKAACSTADPEEWFPEKGSPGTMAKRICRTCPVQPECLEYGLENREEFGIWGGFGSRELTRMRAKLSGLRG